MILTAMALKQKPASVWTESNVASNKSAALISSMTALDNPNSLPVGYVKHGRFLSDKAKQFDRVEYVNVDNLRQYGVIRVKPCSDSLYSVQYVQVAAS